MRSLRRISPSLLLAAVVALAAPAAAADQGMTSPAHRAHVGRIVFSDGPIPFQKEDAERFKTAFRATDTLYGRVYLAQSVGSTEVHLAGQVQKGTARAFEVRLFVGDEEQKLAFGVFHQGVLARAAAQTWTTWRLDLNPAAGDAGAEAKVTAGWAKTVNRLAPGRHAVKVELWVTEGQMRSKGPVAVGTFEIDKQRGDRLESGGRFPADVYAGADLANVKAAARAALLAEGVAKGTADILALAITSTISEGRYVDTKVPYRQVSAAVKWADTDKDGFCRFVTYNFVQDQASKGWTPWRFKSFCNGEGCQEGEVDCE